ncbi:MAG: hypothetical protein ACPGYV_10175 [Phycisphaeraceae bacterium]
MKSLRPVRSLARLSCWIVAWALVLGGHWSAAAQSEGLSLEHSPNGERALRLHGEKLAELESFYEQSLEQPAERFKKTSQRHVDRYRSLLDREMRALTRAGSIEQAEAVQSALRASENWSLTTPDGEGFHFLSKADLSVKDNERATKLGVDLLVDVESAAQSYAKHADRVFKQYQVKVEAARRSLIQDLSNTLSHEQQSGRLEAVQELTAAIEAIEKLPEVERPEPKREPEPGAGVDGVGALAGGGGAEEGPVHPELRGYYMLTYLDADDMNRETIIELRADKALVRGQYKRTKQGQISAYDAISEVDLRLPDNTSMHWRFKENTGKSVLVKLEITQMNDKTYVNRFNARCSYVADHGELSPPKRCVAIRIGVGSDPLEGFRQGAYHMTLDVVRDESGRQRRGEVTFLVDRVQESFLITARTSPRNPNVLDHVIPLGFVAQVRGDEIVCSSSYDFSRRRHVFVIDPQNNGEHNVRYWWDSAYFAKNQPPDATGTLKFRD